MIDLIRDKEGYEIDNRKYIGVTTILKSAGLLHFSRDDAARDRGTKIHQAIKYFYQGRLDIEAQPGWMLGYLAGFAKFNHDMDFKPKEFETTVSDAARGIAGTFDAWGSMRDSQISVMLDWKTGEVQNSAALQMAAYCAMSKRPYLRVAVSLPGDGEYRVRVFPVSELWRDTQRFWQLVEVQRWIWEYQ